MTARRLCHGAARVITGPASGVHSVFSPKSESASGEVSVRSRVNTRNMQRVYIERSDWAVVHTPSRPTTAPAGRRAGPAGPSPPRVAGCRPAGTRRRRAGGCGLARGPRPGGRPQPEGGSEGGREGAEVPAPPPPIARYTGYSIFDVTVCGMRWCAGTARFTVGLSQTTMSVTLLLHELQFQLHSRVYLGSRLSRSTCAEFVYTEHLNSNYTASGCTHDHVPCRRSTFHVLDASTRSTSWIEDRVRHENARQHAAKHAASSHATYASTRGAEKL